MILTFRPIKVWPPGWPNDNGTGSQFSASYSDTLKLLDRELIHLRASDITLQVDTSERECRNDGQLRANAKVGYRGVILSFTTPDHGTLSYPCDAFTRWNRTEAWQANLRAIALGLESLRRVERYGIAQRGQQYAGWAELGTGIALGQGMTDARAWEILKEESGLNPTVVDGPIEAVVGELFKAASKHCHPDNGGDPERFDLVVRARDHLVA